jgi:chemotaxis protein methyltransferase CheR
MAVSVALDGGVSAEDLLQREKLEAIEVGLLLEGLYQYCGEDFRGYSREQIAAKVRALMEAEGLQTISALQECVLHSVRSRAALLRALHSRPTALFDDADYFINLREAIGPLLRSYADPRIWLVDPGSSEEIFALSILLIEEGLYDKSTIFVTSANAEILDEMRHFTISFEAFSVYEENYRRSGGQRSLSVYCKRECDGYSLLPNVKSNITWAQYNLTTDTSFNAFQLILCRRPLAEFGQALRRRVLALFHESIVRFGILGIDNAASFEENSLLAIHYQPVSRVHGLYRRLG